MQLKIAEFFKESQGTDLLYRLQKLFKKDSLFGYIARRSISEESRERERESKAIQPIIEVLEEVINKNKSLVDKFPYREILITYARNNQRRGYYFDKGTIGMSNLIHYTDEELWGIQHRINKTEKSIKSYLKMIGKEENSLNICKINLKLLQEIFQNRIFNEEKLWSGIPSYYFEPGVLLGHNLQKFNDLFESVQSFFPVFSDNGSSF